MGHNNDFSMLTRISKEFHWEMGHRLPFHQGGCQNIHGHSYRAVFEVAGELNSQGMVMDFREVSEILKPLIKELDHIFLADESDTDTISFLKEKGMAHMVVPFFTTAENIAHFLMDKAVPLLPSTISEASLTIYETRTSTARVDWRRA